MEDGIKGYNNNIKLILEVYIMNWKEVRNQYPSKWVLVEAIKAHSSENKRIVEQMAVISEYPNSKDAWRGYKDLHLINSSRELYIFHTMNEEIEVEEERFIGIRRRTS